MEKFFHGENYAGLLLTCRVANYKELQPIKILEASSKIFNFQKYDSIVAQNGKNISRKRAWPQSAKNRPAKFESASEDKI